MFICDPRENVSISSFLLGTAMICIGFIGILYKYDGESPKAIDVYRGKTELEITYEGKTPTDTTIIFKKK